MTGETGDDSEASTDALEQELFEARSKIRVLEGELAETNEGMIALTLELENAKARYQTIFEESNDAILLVDTDQDAIYEANPRACELLGYAHDSLVALTPSDIFPDENERARTFAEAVINGWGAGFTCRTKDGRKLAVDISASMITLDGRPLLLASLRDVTERKRREQRLQVLNRIFRHNLRNDGNVIQGHADLLYAALSGSELEASARQIKETIDEVLTLSNKVRRTQDVLDRERVHPSSIDEILANTLERFEQAYPAATLSVDFPAHDAEVGQRLGAALHEAIENAIKHGHSEPLVEVSAEVIADRERLVLEIRDNGPGIPAHERKAMDAGGETPLTHGSGIGLWFIQWVIDSLGGELAIRSGDPSGTILSIEVPVNGGQAASKRPLWGTDITATYD